MTTPGSWAGEDEDTSILISALEHYAYCPRQCALIHIEQTYTENIYTLRGTQAHERVDTATTRAEGNIRVERALPLWSRRLGLTGRADVVEDHDGTPYPVEYKVGKRREWPYEAIQVCAQGMCLEEMLGVPVPAGAIYYIGSRARREVLFDASLRAAVERIAGEMREMLRIGLLPAAVNDARCEKCSLLDSCLPSVVVRPGRLSSYRARLFTPEVMGDVASDREE
ncbi:MAG TPA: CRISPR-associated protein Cas4 [Ktedonobacterales bacterium]|nr:CRISPR-associated protein Cas4 [Ktedonobacterales bacterium]